MAYVQARKNRDGIVTSYQVRWRDGGGRDGAPASESFDDEPAAELFKKAVNDAGQHWPPGWVPGRGFINADVDEEAERYRFRNYSRRCIENRTGIEGRSRRAYLQELEDWIWPTFGECDVRSVEHFCSDTIRPWVRKLEKTLVRRGRMPDGSPKMKPMSPKTIRNLHGLLSSILREAVQAEPPLRARNPCELTRLPRVDDDVDEEDVEFLTPQEVEALRTCFTTSRQDQLLITVKYGTGLRYSELTALQPRDVLDRHTRKPRLRVQRAWKRDEDGAYYLGKPKTRRSRRTIRISPTVVAAFEELGLDQLPRESLLFTGVGPDSRLHYSTFGDRWARAVARAHKAGLLPEDKKPTPHDLRHSHASALISSGHSLTYVQRRLGHESIKTTSDLYGHLLPEADDDAMESIETSLSGARPRLRSVG
jgi:integrase